MTKPKGNKVSKPEARALKLLSARAMTFGEFSTAMYNGKAGGIASAILGRLIKAGLVEMDITDRYELTAQGRLALADREKAAGEYHAKNL